jgi:type II secretory pathway component PulK
MTHRGFALLAVLWAITAVTVLAGAAVTVARLGSAATRNRVWLARASWARQACVEILLARYAQTPAVRRIDRVDLGRGIWCAVSVEDPSAKLNVNLADRPALVSVLETVVRRGSAVDSLVDALLDWRDRDTVPRPFGEESAANRNGPLADVAELRYVRGFGDSLVAHLSSLLTTRGTGAINVNAAPRAVLAAVPGIGAEGVEILLGQRGIHLVTNADAFVGLLSPASRTTLLGSYPEFVRTAVFAPPQFVAVVTGGVGGTPITASVTLTLVPVAGRLAVIRRESE